LMFFRGMRLLPPRAGITAIRMLGFAALTTQSSSAKGLIGFAGREQHPIEPASIDL
jgi:hypothetical protein